MATPNQVKNFYCGLCEEARCPTYVYLLQKPKKVNVACQTEEPKSKVKKE